MAESVPTLSYDTLPKWFQNYTVRAINVHKRYRNAYVLQIVPEKRKIINCLSSYTAVN